MKIGFRMRIHLGFRLLELWFDVDLVSSTILFGSSMKRLSSVSSEVNEELESFDAHVCGEICVSKSLGIVSDGVDDAATVRSSTA